METQFTPGPWVVGEVRHAGAYQLVTSGQRGYVCDVRCGYVGNELDHDTREANAHLIAAAPELFDALQHILAGALSLPRFAEEEARAALAKARGDQQ